MIEDMNAKNVSFILNASPNPDGCIDRNLLDRYTQIGAEYKQRKPLSDIPNGWLKR